MKRTQKSLKNQGFVTNSVMLDKSTPTQRFLSYKLGKKINPLNTLTLIFCIFFVFSMIPVVSASTPNYILTDLLGDNLINGENDAGDLLFIHSPHIADQHTLTEITNLTVQKFDVLVWQSTTSIKIIPPFGTEQVLVNGNSYKFNYQGQYIIQSIVNSSETSNIFATQENESRVNITILEQPQGFNFNFTPSNFLLTNEQSVKLHVDVDDDIDPGDYEFKYKIYMPGKIVNITKEFTLDENINWTIKNSTLLNKTYKTGTSSYLGFLELKNTGNKEVEIVVSKSGNDTYLIGIPQPQTLYKKSNLRLNFQVQIPSIQETGEYDLEIKIKGGDIEEDIPITLKVEDSLKPNIESINFSTDKVHKENDITVVATDNNDVKRVILKYDDKEISMLKDGNKFLTQQKFIKLSRYVMEFCAYDKINNTACEVVNKTFVKDSVVTIDDPSLELPTKKISKFASIKLLNISKIIPEGVKIQLVELNQVGSSGNYTPTVRIIDSRGTVKSFSQYENEITLTNIGDVKLEIRSDVVADYDGILRIVLPEYVEDVEDIRFQVSFKDYDIPEPFTMDWFDGRKIICDVHDTGNLETSYYGCDLEFPIDVKKEDLSFPTTVREKDKLDTEVAVVEDELTRSKRRGATIITLLIMVLLVVIGSTYYIVEVYPYIRRRAKVKEK